MRPSYFFVALTLIALLMVLCAGCSTPEEQASPSPAVVAPAGATAGGQKEGPVGMPMTNQHRSRPTR